MIRCKSRNRYAKVRKSLDKGIDHGVFSSMRRMDFRCLASMRLSWNSASVEGMDRLDGYSKDYD